MEQANFSEDLSYEFMLSAFNGNLEAVTRLSQDPRVNINFKLEDDNTALFFACHEGKTEVVEFLLRLERLDPNPELHHQGGTPFFHACSNGRANVVAVMLDNERVDITRENHFTKFTPLYSAAYWGYLDVVEQILASNRFTDFETVPDAVTRGGLRTVLNTLNDRLREEAVIKARASIASLFEAFEENPEEVRRRLRVKLGIADKDAGKLFALVVYFSDGYLKPKENAETATFLRFLVIAAHLPIELQMLLCHRVFESAGTIVATKHSEQAFQKYAKE